MTWKHLCTAVIEARHGIGQTGRITQPYLFCVRYRDVFILLQAIPNYSYTYTRYTSMDLLNRPPRLAIKSQNVRKPACTVSTYTI